MGEQVDLTCRTVALGESELSWVRLCLEEDVLNACVSRCEPVRQSDVPVRPLQ